MRPDPLPDAPDSSFPRPDASNSPEAVDDHRGRTHAAKVESHSETVSPWMCPVRAVPLTLDADERRSLTALLEAPEQSPRAYRARVVLLAAQGMRNVEIADRIGLSTATVGKWRNRYAMYGIDGLADDPRPGAPRTINRSVVVETTLQQPPAELGIAHWSSRRLAAYLGISDASVARVWREHGITPRPRSSTTVEGPEVTPRRSGAQKSHSPAVVCGCH